MRKDFLSCYSSRFFHTPNIDALAAEGTVFHNCYANAPSTAMAVTCLFSGLHAHELNRGEFVEVENFDQGSTIFSCLEEKGYETHVVYEVYMKEFCETKSKVFTEQTQVHPLLTFNDFATDKKSKYWKDRSHLEKPEENCLDYVKELKSILEKRTKPVFVWMHCPHNFYPRVGTGNDIDLFDHLVGRIRETFDGDIILTSDHGAMVGERHAYGYGFHDYQGSVSIPLITPAYWGGKENRDLINQSQLKKIILERSVAPQEFAYCDTQYYKQVNRKFMLVKENYKYIYNKVDAAEELYDLRVDPYETVNLLVENFYDYDRNHLVRLDDYFPYKKWKELEARVKEFRAERERIWRTDTPRREKLKRLKFRLNRAKVKFRVWLKFRKMFSKGLFGSKVRYPKS